MRMRKIFKRLASIILIPLMKWYLTRERTYSRAEVNVSVMPGVFHPGLFSSTNFLLEFLQEQDLKDKSFLELGCGTGLLSIVAAKKGARVTASDISSKAIENTRKNAEKNDAQIEVVESDLFIDLPSRAFDWIVINPPYYAKNPANEAELAWYCGENFEYFQKLFTQLKKFLHSESRSIMVLTLECELQQILFLGRKSGYQFDLIREKRAFFDGKNFLYRIRALR